MRQYVNQSQSGTISSSTRKEVDNLQPIIDRVMLIANRLSGAEKELTKTTEKVGNFDSTIKALEFKIKMQDEKINELTQKISELSEKPATTLKPRPARRASRAKTTKVTTKTN